MIQVRRSQPAPKSLETTTSYAGDDVRERLLNDFHGKCWLCERRLNTGWDVEHRLPQAGRFHAERLSWDNLYPADGCNQCRLKWALKRQEPDTAYPTGGLLDPTTDRIQERLSQVLHAGATLADVRVEFTGREPTDQAAHNTAEELDHLHNSVTQNAKLLRIRLHEQYTRILRAAVELMEDVDDREVLNRLRHLVRDDQPFAGVMRDTVRRVHPNLAARVLND